MVETPFMDASEAAVYLRIVKKDGTPNLNALYVWKHKHKVKAFRRGGRLLFRRVDLERALYEERPSRRSA